MALLTCSQVVESLYGYQPGGAAVIPNLAERCAPNAALTVWTCTLRSGVTFHDGSRLDAGDVADELCRAVERGGPAPPRADGHVPDLRGLVRRVPERSRDARAADRAG